MNYRTRCVDSLREFTPAQWDALHRGNGSPFLRHAFLHALHDSGSATEQAGWAPRYLVVEDDTQLLAAMPLYLKTHSYGEYVFDWAWADAYERHGLRYYPKLLGAIPFTPVTGQRMLAANDEARAVLLRALLALQQDNPDLSSTHILFPTEPEASALEQAGFLLRSGVQFHWHNPGYDTFAQFLDTLERKKRKNILAERRKVADEQVTFRTISGRDATESDWHFFYRCYAHTYAVRRTTPYLTPAFFLQLAATMPENLLLTIASRHGTPIAASFVVHDGTRLYGRYWGGLEPIPCLHFETAYYQPLEFCIDNKLQVFEGGAQGEHKLARGFLPVKTHSAHWLRHDDFRDAVERFLEREQGGIAAYMDELNEHAPFRQPSR